MPRRPVPQVGHLIDLATQLRRDEAVPLETLRQRDRAIGRKLDLPASGPNELSLPERAGRATAWLENVTPQNPDRRGGDALNVVGLIAVVLGLLLGYAAAMGLFYYDGSTPVNVVRILAVFVGLQAVTLILLPIATLPGGVPGAAALRGVNPARLATFVARFLPGDTRDALQQIMGRGGSHQRVYGRVRKWQLLNWSQSMALAFNLAATCGALQLIVFSDLGFGWSTTLDVDADRMHAITSAVSGPWSVAWPDAVPDETLVEATQTYRAENFELQVAAAESARWWPFLVMSMIAYGVLPRVFTLIWTRWRLREAVVRAVAFTPGVDRVLDRLVAEVIATRGSEHESPPPGSDAASSVAAPTSDAGCVIRWAEAPGDERSLHAGGGRTLDDDRRAIEAATHAAGALRIRVKAWEPPVLEFLDFVKDLRSALGDGRVIEVQPVGEGDRAMWQRKLTGVGDPWLRMVGEGGGDGSGGVKVRSDYENQNENDTEGGHRE